MGLIKCLQCPKVFFRKASQVAKYKRAFCSRRCKAGYQKEHPEVCGPPRNSIIIPCHSCGKEVQRWPSVIMKRTFCSRECASVTLIKKGSDHFMWKGGVSPYPPEFNKWTREKIRRRDAHQCRSCGSRGTSKHRLEVHHKDENKSNNSDSNLITLCKVCHDAVHCGKIQCPGELAA